jgi:hypothetical protein
MTTRFRADQIVRLSEFASSKFHIDLATRALARAFEISHSAMTLAKLRGYEGPLGEDDTMNLRSSLNKVSSTG